MAFLSWITVSGCGASGSDGGEGGAGTAGSATAGSGGVSSPGSAGASGSGGAAAGSGGASAGSGGVAAGSGGASAGSGGSVGSAGTGGSTSVGAAGQSGTGGGPSKGGAGGGAAGAPAPASALLGDVSFSTPSQSFKGTLTVGLSTTITGAEIRYTTDGTLPTASSPVYANPLMLSATTEVRAQPFVGGTAGGLVSTGLYIARTFDLTSKLPIMILDGYGKGMPPKPANSTVQNPYREAAVLLYEPTAGGMADVSKLPTTAARAGYHLRGQSSSMFPQKPYKVELWDNQNADAKLPLLGMPADADWALIAPYHDRSLIRNPFTYTLGQEMGLAAPRTQFVEVYINYAARPVSADDYQGIYWLSETLKVNNHRLDLAKLKETDLTAPAITGGYVFKFDYAATDATAPHLTCTGSDLIVPANSAGTRPPAGGNCWIDCEVSAPEPVPAAQLTWLTQYVQSFHNVLHTTPIGDYGQYVDVPSFIDLLIVTELTRNLDAYIRSAYYYKDRDGKLKGGPLWDYNFAYGIGVANNVDPKGGMQYAVGRDVNHWFPKLMGDPAFAAKVKTRWKALRQGLLSDASIDARIAALTATLPADAVARDYAKWPVNKVYSSAGGALPIVGPSTATTFDAQKQAFRTFVVSRAAFMDTQWQ